MRENMGLYRGKRLDNGEWVEGAFCPKCWSLSCGREVAGPRIIKLDAPHSGVWFAVNPSTVGQFTGLLDKNGKWIFEGDVVLKRTYNGKKAFPVEFGGGMFYCGFGGGSSTATHRYTLEDKQIEVIGNIHDNPELLEVNKND